MSDAKRYANFDGMFWPIPEEHTEFDSVEWKLRYSPQTLSREDMLYAASIINAYSSLIHKTIKNRNAVVKGIREAILKEDI